MFINRSDCRKMSDEEIHKRIKCYTECGWIFEGILEDSPPPHKWLSFVWDKDNEPVYPVEYLKE